MCISACTVISMSCTLHYSYSAVSPVGDTEGILVSKIWAKYGTGSKATMAGSDLFPYIQLREGPGLLTIISETHLLFCYQALCIHPPGFVLL